MGELTSGGERGLAILQRAVDNCKRMPAMFMVMAVGLMVSNGYSALRDLNGTPGSVAIIMCAFLILVLLMLPTYLMSEQYLDNKYVAAPQRAANSHGRFLLDLLIPLVLASLFVAIAQTFYETKFTTENFVSHQSMFCAMIALFCVADAIFMMIHAGFGAHDALPNPLRRAHIQSVKTLIKIDLYCAPVFWAGYFLTGPDGSRVNPVLIFAGLLGVQMIRFVVEMRTYDTPLVASFAGRLGAVDRDR